MADARAQPAASSDRSADANAICAHIESIFQAFIDKDRPKLEATHGAHWRGFTPFSGAVIRERDGYMKQATFPTGLPKGQGMVAYLLARRSGARGSQAIRRRLLSTGPRNRAAHRSTVARA